MHLYKYTFCNEYTSDLFDNCFLCLYRLSATEQKLCWKVLIIYMNAYIPENELYLYLILWSMQIFLRYDRFVIWCNIHPVTVKVDIWSFGVCVWEMLTCEMPYKNVDSSAIIWGVGSNSLQLPIPSTCPDGFKLLVKQCWSASANIKKIKSDCNQIFDTILFLLISTKKTNPDPN